MLLWATSAALTPTTSAAEDFQNNELQHVSRFARSITSLSIEPKQLSHVDTADGVNIARRAATVSVATEAELKAAIEIDGNIVLITKDITLTVNSIRISSGTITVSVPPKYIH